MHVFRKSKAHDSSGQRLHSSPSLPNLWLPPHNRPLAVPDSPVQSRSPTSKRAHLGPLDLAPSKYPSHAPSSPSSSHSGLPSPRRPPLPLTPPLTPSSSLNENLSQAGNPVTPTDNDRSPVAPCAARWPRQTERYRTGHGSRGVISLEDSDESDVDLTPTEHPFVEPACKPKPREQVSHLTIGRYLNQETPISRFLLVGDVPKAISNDAIKKMFGEYGDSKGIWAGHLQSFGIVILAFFDLRTSEAAKRSINSREVRVTVGDVQCAIQMRANFVSLSEAKELTGNPSPVTEIEKDAAFYIQIKDQFTPSEAMRAILDAFGRLLAFRNCNWKSEKGQWFYVEYYDVRDTQAALQDLHTKHHALDAQFSLYPAPALPHPLDTSDSASLSSNAIPFPSAGSPTNMEYPSLRNPRPRSASAEAGDGMKAFTDPASLLADSLRRRLAVPRDWSESGEDSSERQRCLSFDTSRRGAEEEEQEAVDGEPVYQSAYPPQVPMGGEIGYPEIRGPGYTAGYEGGAYEYPPTEYFIPTATPAYVPHYVLSPRQILPQAPRRASRGLEHAPAPMHHTSHHRQGSAHYHSHASHHEAPYHMEPTRQTNEAALSSHYSPHPAPLHNHAPPGATTPENNQLNISRIANGLDTRTTVMIKNIPNKMSDRDLMGFIERVCVRKVDFFYLRMDFQNGCNVGYAFVNFITVKDLLTFAKARLGVKWNMYSSEKVLQMSYANYQGKEALVEKFKNSGIMDERESWRPKIFYSEGPEQGLPEPFPAPTHQRRKERSAHNRGALFVPGVART
ncbi:hypothetical protein BV25DRAFT_1830527 [Artomyces pyxidatus]|uniref:Uncharacterized protein n=1 Tax=Artomyces pyxidatus TaxID=48021 RepID=A0ACB8SP36_9AGAM|nr:hypothetical protein BV25DRAFT_1830527 [Artomyces pyxidatus]